VDGGPREQIVYSWRKMEATAQDNIRITYMSKSVLVD